MYTGCAHLVQFSDDVILFSVVVCCVHWCAHLVQFCEDVILFSVVVCYVHWVCSYGAV